MYASVESRRGGALSWCSDAGLRRRHAEPPTQQVKIGTLSNDRLECKMAVRYHTGELAAEDNLVPLPC